jgi:hypothetical protein
MSDYPKLDELFEVIIKDSYDYLYNHSNEETKNSIHKLLELKKDTPEIERKTYVVFCSINKMEPSSDENSSIFSFTKNSIRTIYEFFEQNKSCKLSTINDICNCYIIIFGYEYIFKGLFENEFLVFSIEYYKNYVELLNKYNISKEVQNYYADTLDLFTDKKKMKQNFRFLIVLLDIF